MNSENINQLLKRYFCIDETYTKEFEFMTYFEASKVIELLSLNKSLEYGEVFYILSFIFNKLEKDLKKKQENMKFEEEFKEYSENQIYLDNMSLEELDKFEREYKEIETSDIKTNIQYKLKIKES